MAVVNDIETQVEDAFIGLLGAYSDITSVSSVRRWKDASSDKAYPAVAVHCSPAGNDPATPTEDTGKRLYNPVVEIGIFTYQHDDKSLAVARSQIGAVRDCLKQGGVLASLEAVSGVDLSFYGLEIGSGDHSVDDENVNQVSLSIVCHVGL